MDRIFGLDQQTLISIAIQLFNACLLAAVLAVILYKPVRKFLRKRSDTIEEQINNAEDSAVKANEMKALYEQKLEELEAERISILESTQAKAAEKSKQMLREAEEEIVASKKQAADDIQSERKRIDEEVRLEIIEVASLMAEKFVALSIDENTRNIMFEKTIAEMEAAL